MKIEKIKNFFAKNKELMPLSFNNLVYKENAETIKTDKTINSEKYKDSSYSVFKFYKPISRLK